MIKRKNPNKSLKVKRLFGVGVLWERWVCSASIFVPAMAFFRIGGGCWSLNGGWSEAGNVGTGQPSSPGEGGWNWANVVGGQLRQPLWMANKVSKVEIDQLRHLFTKILEFP